MERKTRNRKRNFDDNEVSNKFTSRNNLKCQRKSPLRRTIYFNIIQVPEVICTPIMGGSKDYIQWVYD